MPGVILHGFDVSSGSIARIPDELRVNSNLFTSSLSDLDYDYDTGLLVTVLHHVLSTSERHEVIANIHERLRPGGMLVIIEHNMLNPLTRKVVTSSEIDRDAIMLAPRECVSLLKASGFEEIHSRYIVFFPERLGFMRCLDGLLAHVPLGAQFMACGKKGIV